MIFMKKIFIYIIFIVFLTSCQNEKVDEFEKTLDNKKTEVNTSTKLFSAGEKEATEKKEEKKNNLTEKKIIKKEVEYKTIWELYSFKEDGSDDLILGSKWETVKKLQEILNKLWYLKWNITWYYDKKTLEAQKKLLLEKCHWPKNNTWTFWPLARKCLKKIKIKIGKKIPQEGINGEKNIVEWKTKIPEEFLKTIEQKNIEKEKIKKAVKIRELEKKKKEEEMKIKKENEKKLKIKKEKEEKLKREKILSMKEYEAKRKELIRKKAMEKLEAEGKKNMNLKDKVEMYKQTKIAEAKTGIDKKIAEEEKIIRELEEKLKNHKKFLEEYKNNKNSFNWEKKIIKNNNPKTLSPESSKGATKEKYEPEFWFFKKWNWTIICKNNANLSWVNFSTFKEIWDWYARDISKIYYNCETIKTWKINDFRIIKFGFAKDKKNAYYLWKKILVKDIASFDVKSKWFFEIAYDKNNVYLYDNSKIMKVLNWVSYGNVEFLDKTYLKAWDKIFSLKYTSWRWDFVRVFWVDVKTFEAIVYSYAKDKNTLYYKWNKIPNIDPKTAEVFSYSKVKDKNGTWIVWIDGITFSKVK